ncbi:MAG TPA: hypothetical protein VIY52_23940 [Streptosporangiaceae bacterium]
MLDEDLRAQLAELVRPVATLSVPEIRVLRRRARRRGIRRAAAAAAITAVVAAVAIGVTVSMPGTRPPGPVFVGGTGAWPAAPGTWAHGAWQPAGRLPAADAGPTAAPYAVVLPGDETAQVRDVFTGRIIATVSPDGQLVAGVAAAGDDHTFILAGLEPGSVAFDELRLQPDGQPASVRLLFTLPGNVMPAFAVSPDASMLAYMTDTGFETVSLAAGTGRAWTAGGDSQAFSLSWGGDRTLAFEWAPRSLAAGSSLPPGAGIRLLDVTAPGSMLQASRLIIPYCASGQVCAQGPQITPDGSRVLATRLVLSQAITTNVEEYSARTGKALAGVTPAVSSPRGDAVCGVLWSDASGAQVVSYCGRVEGFDRGHVGPVSLHLPVSLLNAHDQALAW